MLVSTVLTRRTPSANTHRRSGIQHILTSSDATNNNKIIDPTKNSNFTTSPKAKNTMATINTISTRSNEVSSLRTIIAAAIYVLSGATQPLLMTVVKSVGLGDTSCQLYMLFYYFGPSLVALTLLCPNPADTTITTSSFDESNTTSTKDHDATNSTSKSQQRKDSITALCKAAFIATIDIVAQTLNYTGSTFSGPTIFAIVYSSVTVWTAVYSRILLSRSLYWKQWIGIITVFVGLTITAFGSVAVGPDIFKGTVMVLFGSSMHAITYVLSEAIMVKKGESYGAISTSDSNGSSTTSRRRTNKTLTVQQNCAIQGIVALTAYSIWQVVYTKHHFQDKVLTPMKEHGTTPNQALLVLLSLSMSNLIHALSFFYTLKHFPGGATSAGVMKGLQAVLVFLFSSVVYCGKTNISGGSEMCFTLSKLASLVVVVGGVLLFAISSDNRAAAVQFAQKQQSSGATQEQKRTTRATQLSTSHDDATVGETLTIHGNDRRKDGYESISIVEEGIDDHEL